MAFSESKKKNHKWIIWFIAIIGVIVILHMIFMSMHYKFIPIHYIGKIEVDDEHAAYELYERLDDVDEVVEIMEYKFDLSTEDSLEFKEELQNDEYAVVFSNDYWLFFIRKCKYEGGIEYGPWFGPWLSHGNTRYIYAVCKDDL